MSNHKISVFYSNQESLLNSSRRISVIVIIVIRIITLVSIKRFRMTLKSQKLALIERETLLFKQCYNKTPSNRLSLSSCNISAALSQPGRSYTIKMIKVIGWKAMITWRCLGHQMKDVGMRDRQTTSHMWQALVNLFEPRSGTFR